MSNSVATPQEVPAAAATKKRQIDSADFEQQKRSKTENGGETHVAAALAGSTGDDQEGNWDCPACGNLNWPKRTVCNRANCNQRRPGTEFASVGPEHPEGSWGCLQCKNVNWPKRTTCNRCQAPKHGGPQGFGGQFVGGGHMNSGGVQHPEGSWMCCKCQNTNWPLRTECNRCQEPRATADMAMVQMGMMQQQQQQYFTPPQLYGAMAAGPQAFAGMPMAYNGAMAAAQQTQFSAAPVSRQAGGKGGQFQHPAGSWDCAKCDNTNWPLRNACNRCKEPKPASAKAPASMAAAPVQQIQYLPQQQMYAGQQQMYAGGAQYAQAGYGGYAAAAAPRMMAAVAPATRADGHPEGSWNCVKCQNVNWPRRTSCNRCQEQKPASAQ